MKRLWMEWKKWWWALVLVFLSGFFAYKILEVPTGLTLDEAAFGYNAALLAQTGRDENGRRMPVFVLSSNQTDWRQPVPQYYYTLLFKLFGPSVWLLRFSSVILLMVSVVLLWQLSKELLGKWGRLGSVLVLLTAPLIMIQAHMGLDNIVPLPLGLLWLWMMLRLPKTNKTKDLVIAALSLGVAYYSYKGMRGVVPVWMGISVIWLWINKISWNSFKKNVMVFGLVLAPFFLAIPWLEKHYAGAMLGGSTPAFKDVYEFFWPYLSSFDIAYWFVKGDDTVFHSTGKHGVVLLATLPLFVGGLFLAIRENKKEWWLMLVCFILTPLLYGLVGSIHRFSRLIVMVPMVAMLCGLAVEELSKKWKWGLVAVMVMVLVNFGDFLKYYYNEYPKITDYLFGTLMVYKDVEELKKLAVKTHLKPVMDKEIVESGGVSMKFFQTIYFGKMVDTLVVLPSLPSGELLLTNKDKLQGLERIYAGQGGYSIFEKK